MNTFDDHDDLIFDDRLDAQRDIIRQSLDQITNDIGMAMRDVGLTFPATSPFGTLERSRDDCDPT